MSKIHREDYPEMSEYVWICLNNVSRIYSEHLGRMEQISDNNDTGIIYDR